MGLMQHQEIRIFSHVSVADEFSVLLQLLTILNFFLVQSLLWKFQPGLQALPAETTKLERYIQLYNCNTSCVYSNPVRVWKTCQFVYNYKVVVVS